MWGCESSFGRFNGGHDCLSALASLAFTTDPPARADYFRRELLLAMQASTLHQGSTRRTSFCY
eukprot:1189619-Prorocentrum_minimum.AAC.1